MGPGGVGGLMLIFERPVVLDQGTPEPPTLPPRASGGDGVTGPGLD
jgi:hypothetical protein